MSSNFSVKQRFEAHLFEGLCKTGTISWPGGPWLPTLSILDTLGPEKVVLIWLQAQGLFPKWLIFSVTVSTRFFLLVLKTVGLEHFVFSTVYIQHLFSGVHP